jgi:hypothetical protein
MDETIVSVKNSGMKKIVLGGRFLESNIKFYEGKGFKRKEVIDNYWEEDKESDGKGILYEFSLVQ